MIHIYFQKDQLELLLSQQNIPPGLKELKLLYGEAYGACGDFGDVLVQDIKGDGFHIRYCNYLIREEVNFTNVCDTPGLVLHIVLSNDCCLQSGDMEVVLLREMQFNLAYLPAAVNMFFPASQTEYSTFDVYCTPAYLSRFTDVFPMLNDWLQRPARGETGLINASHSHMDLYIRRVVADILKCGYIGEPCNIYINARIGELLLLVLEKMQQQQPAGSLKRMLSETDITNLRIARDWLHKNMSAGCSLKKLAQMAGINEYKLKWGFKQLLGTTVFGYLADIRMEKAMELLLKKDMLIKDISLQVGFKHVPSFVIAFRQKFGYSPGLLKRKKKADCRCTPAD